MITQKNIDYQLMLRGSFLVALSGVLYGLIGYLGTKLFQQQLSVTAMSFWRFVIATLWILFTTRASKAMPKSFSLLKMLIFCAFFYAISSAQYFIATEYIGTGSAMVIFFCFPVFVALFTWLFDDSQIDAYAMSAMFLVIAGVLLLKGRGAYALNLTGIGIAISAAFFYASYIYCSKSNAHNYDTRMTTFYICLFNAILFLGLALANRTFTFPTTLNAWFYLIIIGTISTAIPIRLLLDGLKYISPVKASILSVLEPVVTVLVGILCLNESIVFMQILGIITILLGALLIQLEGISIKGIAEYEQNLR